MFSLRPAMTIDQARVQLSVRQPVRWTRLRVAGRVPPHDHEFTEICLIMAGRAIHVTEAGRAPVRAGHALIVPPGQVHAFEKTTGLEVVNVYFLAEWFLPELRLESDNDGILPLFFARSFFARPEFHGVHHFVLPPFVLPRVLAELADIGTAATSVSHRWIACCFFKALLHITHAVRRQISGESSVQASSTVWLALAEIDRLVASGQKLDLARLAQNFGITRDHLARLFHRDLAQTPKTFHQRRRLQYACRLLLNEALNLSEIAHRLGYADEAHLCRLFRREFAITPKAYRHKFQERSTQPH